MDTLLQRREAYIDLGLRDIDKARKMADSKDIDKTIFILNRAVSHLKKSERILKLTRQ